MKKIVLYVFFIILFIEIFNTKTTISTENKSLLSGNNSIGYRDLIMISSLAYENLPSSCNYNKETGVVSNGCMFKKSDIEGLSESKVKSMTRIPTSYTEDGQAYYFYLYADISELDGWSIVDYNEFSIQNSNYGSSKFVAYTFNKGNDYVITYRGNEYIDLLEWGQDMRQNISKVFSEINTADSYANKIYSKISNNCSTCNIYVTGYSLGGYLAQSAGASLANKNLLKKVVYFNSPGISSILSFDNSNLTNNIVKEKTENLKKISEKLLLYTIKGDPVSSLGKHYGEIRQLNPSLGTIEHHENFVETTVENSEIINNNQSSGIQKLMNWINNLKNILQTTFKYENSVSNAQLAKKNFNSAKVILNLNETTVETSGFNSVGGGTFDGISLIKNNMNKTMSEYNITGINELLSIAHEPDSFLCIVEGEKGIPKVTFAIYDSNSGTKVKNTFFTRGLKGIELNANVTNGCATSYQWQKCSDSTGTTCKNIIGATESTYVIPSKIVRSTMSDTYYRLKVSYGNNYLSGTLDSNGEYIYINISNTNYFYTDIQTIKIDKTAPYCTVNSKSISRGKTGIVTVKCSDNMGIKLYLSEDSFDRNRIYATIEKVYNQYDYSDLTIKQGWLALGSTKFTLKSGEIKDYAGNSSNSFTFTIDR